MTYNPDIHQRRSIRLKEYDYSQPGLYFITICAKDRENLFGQIENGKMILNVLGEIVRNEWLKTAEIRNNVELLEYIIMPNHIHGIIHIVNKSTLGAHSNVPLLQQKRQTEQFGKSTKNSIPTIVKLFKSTVTKHINVFRKSPGEPVWQRNFYEHIIRNEKSYHHIAEYIRNNPMTWQDDSYFE